MPWQTTLATIFQGTNFVFNSSGEFFYSGIPGAGNLLYSNSATNGIDTFGNAYIGGGPVSYNSTNFLAYTTGQSGITVWSATSQAGPYTQVANLEFGAGFGWEFSTSSGTITISTTTAIALGGMPTPATVSGLGQLFSNVNGTPAGLTGGGFAGALDITEPANTTTNATVNAQTTLSKLSNVWSIPANDAQAGTVYRLTAGGVATWGATQEVLTLALAAFGVANFVSLPIGATEFTAGLSLQWRYQADIVVVSPGNPGTIMGGASFDIGVAGANQLTNAGTNQSAGGFAAFNAANATANTVSAGNITLQAKWGAAFGSITCDYSYLERLGA
jgi:hypothetical protein